MMTYPYDMTPPAPVNLGLVVLQSDETIEGDFRRLLPADLPFYVSRVPSGQEVTRETLGAMRAHLPAAAGLFPRGLSFAAVGYGCTSGTAEIGPERVADLVRGAVETRAVSEPVSALVAACRHLGLRRIAFLSPYVAEVSANLRGVLAAAGIDSPLFGSFDEAEEARVTRISAASIQAAAQDLLAPGGVDGLFLSCTNLRTLDVIAPLEAATGLPVLSSNQVLAWHMLRLAGQRPGPQAPGRLVASA